MFSFSSSSKSARSAAGLVGGFAAATTTWLIWAWQTVGDTFADGSFLVWPSLALATLGGFGLAYWQIGRRFRLGLALAAVVATSYWIFAPEDWWVTPLPEAGLASTAPGLEGVYCTCSEIGGFSGTVLELRDGKFRYWFYSDVMGLDEPRYPITGDYLVRGNRLVLGDKRIYEQNWFSDTVNGIRVLWRDDGRQVWREQHKIYDYAVLIKTNSRLADNGAVGGASIRSLYDAGMRKRIRFWKDPFVYGPQ